MRFHMGAAAILAVALSSAVQAATFPDEAPAGKMWMSCFVALKDTEYGAKNPIALGGYWLIDVPEGTRKETLDRLKAQWLDEYLDRIPAEFPGFVPRIANGQVYDARCGSYYDRSDFPAYGTHHKEPVTSQGVFRSDFVPSFAEAWISSREYARDYTGEVASSGNIKPSKPAITKPSAPPTEVTIAAPKTTLPGKNAAELRKQQAEEAEAAREQREAVVRLWPQHPTACLRNQHLPRQPRLQLRILEDIALRVPVLLVPRLKDLRRLVERGGGGSR